MLHCCVDTSVVNDVQSVCYWAQSFNFMYVFVCVNAFFTHLRKTVDFKFVEQSPLIKPVFINSTVYGIVKFVLNLPEIGRAHV